MKNETFAELLGSVTEEALEHAQGKRSLPTTTLARPPASLSSRDVKRLRATLHASQTVFANYLNVSTKLVQAWEGSRRNPDGAALVLLHIVSEQPETIEAIRHPIRRAVARRSRSRTPGQAHA